MPLIRKKPHRAEFKFKVALEAIRGEKTLVQLCQEYGVVSSQIAKWKKVVLEQGAGVFSGTSSGSSSCSNDIDKLHATIGRLKVENDFLERVLGKSR